MKKAIILVKNNDKCLCYHTNNNKDIDDVFDRCKQEGFFCQVYTLQKDKSYILTAEYEPPMRKIGF